MFICLYTYTKLTHTRTNQGTWVPNHQRGNNPTSLRVNAAWPMHPNTSWPTLPNRLTSPHPYFLMQSGSHSRLTHTPYFWWRLSLHSFTCLTHHRVTQTLLVTAIPPPSHSFISLFLIPFPFPSSSTLLLSSAPLISLSLPSLISHALEYDAGVVPRDRQVLLEQWGQVVADGMASRRLFARSRPAATSVFCSVEAIQIRLQVHVFVNVWMCVYVCESV